MTTRRPIRRALVGLLTVAIILQSPGCAFLFHKNQNMVVACKTPGATLTINGKPVELEKGTFPLRTGDDHTLTVEAPGYRPKTVVVKGRENFALRYLIFDSLWILAYGAGIVMLIVDLTTGCMWDHTPAKRIDFELEPDPAAARELAARREPRREPERTPERPRNNPLAPRPNDPAPAPQQPVRPQPVAPRDTQTPAKPPQTPVKPPPPAPKNDPAVVHTPPPPPPPPPGRTRVLAIGAGSPSAEAAAATMCTLTVGPDAKKLVGAQATRQAILREVREHLERHVGNDDRAILFLACGLSWVDDELYLTTADTNPDDLAGTAIPATTLSTYLERVEGALVLVVVNGPISDAVPAANALALDGAILVVGEGDLARTLSNGLRPDGADANGDASVSGPELTTWLESHATVRGGASGAIPVQR